MTYIGRMAGSVNSQRLSLTLGQYASSSGGGRSRSRYSFLLTHGGMAQADLGTWFCAEVAYPS